MPGTRGPAHRPAPGVRRRTRRRPRSRAGHRGQSRRRPPVLREHRPRARRVFHARWARLSARVSTHVAHTGAHANARMAPTSRTQTARPGQARASGGRHSRGAMPPPGAYVAGHRSTRPWCLLRIFSPARGTPRLPRRHGRPHGLAPAHLGRVPASALDARRGRRGHRLRRGGRDGPACTQASARMGRGRARPRPCLAAYRG